jgi:hypothetical protein
MINQRNRAWQRFLRGDADANGVYSRLRSRCKAALRSFLVQSERKVLTSKNRKLFYSFLNKRLKISTGISGLQRSDGSLAISPADILSTEFVSNYSSVHPQSDVGFSTRSTAECESSRCVVR